MSRKLFNDASSTADIYLGDYDWWLEKKVGRLQVQVFWVVTPCSVAVGYQRFVDLAASIFT
jgi:hypothetical protein